MGQRSTFVSEYYGSNLPEWFYDKYKDVINEPNGTLISSKQEIKLYTNDFLNDYHKALKESGILDEGINIRMSVLTEGGHLTYINITSKGVEYYIDDFGYIQVDSVYHGGSYAIVDDSVVFQS